jgi:hypothetical protein
MSRGEFMLFSKPAPEKFQAVKSLLDSAGIRCVSYYTATIKDNSDLDNAVRFARLLGAGNVTGDATGDILKRIDERFHQGRIDLRDSQSLLQAEVCVREPGRCSASAVRPLENDGRDGRVSRRGTHRVLRIRYGGRGPHAGAAPQDGTPERRAGAGGEVNVLLGKGLARIPEVMSELRQAGCGGLIAIEYEHEGPVEEDVRIEVECARRLL